MYGEKVIVASSTGAALNSWIVSVRSGHVTLRPSTMTELDFTPDNILVRGNKIFVSGFPKILSFLAEQRPKSVWGKLREWGLISRFAWSQIVELSPHETDWFMGDRLQSKTLLLEDGAIVHGSTVAVEMGEAIVVGSVISPGLYICTI